MTNLNTLANLFQKQLIKNAVDTMSMIREVMGLAQKVYSLKDRWLSEAEYEPMVSSPLQNILQIAKQYYSNAEKNGLTAQQHVGYLSKLDNEITDLQSAKLVKPLDIEASNALDNLNYKLKDIVPVSIPPKHMLAKVDMELPDGFENDVNMPMDYLSTDVSNPDEGAAYPMGAEESELDKVVKNFGPKPEWTGFFDQK